MDGGSTDGTVDILSRYQGRLTYVSERDNGQSDAINKGWARAKGDIIAWLCADDLYLPDTVQIIVNTFIQHPETMWVYGYASRIDRHGQSFPFRAPTLTWSFKDLLEESNFITQPTVFLRRDILKSKGYLKPDLHYAMDYEYWLRIGQDYPPFFLNRVLALVRYYPETKSASGGFKRLDEYQEIMKRYGANTLVKGYRYFWTRSHLDAVFQQIRRGDWAAARSHFQSLVEYPGYIPRASLRKLADATLSEEMQRKLRLLFIKQHQS
jgi:glycosyltransferase involved in cell wall biosynthesis